MMLLTSDKLTPAQNAVLLHIGFVFCPKELLFSPFDVTPAGEHSCTVINYTDSVEDMLDSCIQDYTAMATQTK